MRRGAHTLNNSKNDWKQSNERMLIETVLILNYDVTFLSPVSVLCLPANDMQISGVTLLPWWQLPLQS